MYSKQYEVTALQLADYIADKYAKQGKGVLHSQIEKFLFYIQSECLKNGFTAFEDDIEAWEYGSVVPNVYEKYNAYSVMPIAWIPRPIVEIPQKLKEISDNVVDKLYNTNPWTLSITNCKGVWKYFYNPDPVSKPGVIPLDYIKDDTTFSDILTKL